VDKRDYAAADPPVVGHAERTHLAVGCSMIVQDQEVGDPLVAAGNRDAVFSHCRDTSHHEHAGQVALEGRGILGAKQFGCCAQVNDRRLEFQRPLLDRRRVGGQEQRRQLRGWPDIRSDRCRRFER
jgi:hypothetical protein